ncbi:uncharacterized protein B0H18DRAFT_1036161, partial [Fomitopsis serialis]|uniref:uncharacterized protein n=1 Tax=Fomitopsis serialis TaxID=139415 RepID=UPI002007CB64
MSSRLFGYLVYAVSALPVIQLPHPQRSFVFLFRAQRSYMSLYGWQSPRLVMCPPLGVGSVLCCSCRTWNGSSVCVAADNLSTASTKLRTMETTCSLVSYQDPPHGAGVEG